MLSRQKHINGVGMVEVLVALVVVGVGMLGIASLYVTTLQAKTTAQARMKAINFAYDIADRIRANRTGGTDYTLQFTDTKSAPAATANCVQNSSTAAVNCTPAQMAANDLYLWDKLVMDAKKGLPAAQRKIEYSNVTIPATYKITLQWTEPNSGTQNYVLEIQI